MAVNALTRLAIIIALYVGFVFIEPVLRKRYRPWLTAVFCLALILCALFLPRGDSVEFIYRGF
jgi:hypothetical protein